MFTGLIQATGHIKTLKKNSQSILMTIQTTPQILADYQISDSMAVDGACLTAIEKTPDTFTVEMMPISFQRTAIKNKQVGQLVNLERTLPANGRVEGHFVLGHVDGTTLLLKRITNENAIELTFALPAKWRSQIIPRGSVAINGVSLTVMDTGSDWFRVGIIPHTQAMTDLGELKIGDLVNIETDILGKYILAGQRGDQNER